MTSYFATRRRFLGAAGGLAVMAAGVACGGDDDDDAGESTPPGNTPAGSTTAGAPGSLPSITVADSFQPPNYLDGGGVFAIREGMGEGLVRVGFTSEFESALADSWEQPDDTTWTFALRPGVTFHDGTDLTTDAVVTALRRLAESEAVTAAFRGATIEADDAGTIRIVTSAPLPFMPAVLADGEAVIYSPASWEMDPATALPAGTGPFRLVEFLPDEKRRLEGFVDYWDGAPQLAAVDWLMVPDGQTRASLIRAGDIDIVRVLDPIDLPVLQGESGLDVLTTPLPRVRALYPNVQREPTTDPRVRKALAHAVSRQIIVDTVLEFQGEVQTSIFRADMPWGNPELTAPAEDVAEARALLEAAGYGDDNRLALTLSTYSSRPELPDLAQVLAQQFGEAGIDIEIDVADTTVFEERGIAGEHQLALVARNPLWLYDPQGLYESDYLPNGSYNMSQYTALEADIRAAGTMTDTEERYAQYREMERRIIEEDVATIALNSYIQIDAHVSAISGYESHPTDAIALTNRIAKA